VVSHSCGLSAPLYVSGRFILRELYQYLHELKEQTTHKLLVFTLPCADKHLYLFFVGLFDDCLLATKFVWYKEQESTFVNFEGIIVKCF